MATKKKTRVNSQLLVKARQVLAFAQERVQTAADWVELHMAIFGIEGMATNLFPTESERTAFTRTAECKRIHTLCNRLPDPPVQGIVDLTKPANGTFTVTLPHSVHAALLAEAQAEGVSLNQLCLSKLVAQLRTVVESPKQSRKSESVA